MASPREAPRGGADLLSDGRRKYYSPAEVAAYFGVSTRTVYRLVKRGEVRAVRIGESVRIPRGEVLRYESEGVA